jgi:hypothetical protein
MKNHPSTPTYFIIVLSFTVALSSCDKKNNLATNQLGDTTFQIKPENLLRTDPSKKNAKALKEFSTHLHTFTRLQFKSIAFTEMQSSLDVDKDKIPDHEKLVSIKDEIGKLFDPNNLPCPLPNKVKRRLKDSKWAPQYVAQRINSLPDSGLFINGKSLAAVLNTVTLKKNKAQLSEVPIFNSPSFKTFDASTYIIAQGFSSFFYTLDCSGYMNAALQVDATAIVGNVEGNAKSALDIKSSMFVGGGTLASPIYSAMYDNTLGTALDTTTMIKILTAVVNAPNITVADSIIVPSAFVVVWSSNTGTSGFNGEGDVSGKVGAGLGIAKFSAQGSAGGTISRQSSYTDYNTYVIDTKKLTMPQTIAVSDVQLRIAALKKSKTTPNM